MIDKVDYRAEAFALVQMEDAQGAVIVVTGCKGGTGTHIAIAGREGFGKAAVVALLRDLAQQLEQDTADEEAHSVVEVPAPGGELH